MHAARLATRPARAHAPVGGPDPFARLNWLLAAEAADACRARLFRTPREEREMLLMRRPITTGRAFARFGLLLGTLPPAAIFFRLSWWLGSADDTWLPLLFPPMLLICALLGRLMGAQVGKSVGDFESGNWARTVCFALLAGFGWASVTGAAGGILFFGLGAIAGAASAIAVALPAFLVFTSLHRLLARGGMIDARHLRPLAWGVPATVAALILSPYLLPY
ncbi:MAG: hypothetical protein LC800_06890 [Acidobacteria bacterium]|nr:hypothetical protein [Acidobacteriota bacterium]